MQDFKKVLECKYSTLILLANLNMDNKITVVNIQSYFIAF